ncbi:MFS transporter [Streptomyces sp. NRRL F-5126]|uniref:MFS transporter n=1 Tax=Streptomyces sp. NRRL F-5126 TaxID=1463857 RepID=UPI00099C9ABC|nr:MFS transporter [Streptomyces sp. NRRL F-5126]
MSAKPPAATATTSATSATAAKDVGAQPVPRARWLRVLPAVVLIYVVASLDKSNISYAVAGGMSKTLALSTTFSGLVAGIFFIGYLFLQVPGAMIAERRSAKAYVAWTVAAFGVVSILSGLVQSGWQMVLVRFLLGVTEGGLFPAILIIITRWFPNQERGRANGFFLMNGAIAGVVGGPFAGWLITLGSWRTLFIAEGLLSFALLAACLPLISNRPEESTSLSRREKDYLAAKFAEEHAQETAPVDRKVLIEVLKQPTTWKLVLVYFCMSVGIYGFSLWLPTTIKNLTHTGIGMAALLSALPNLVSMAGCFFLAAWSDRRGNRRFWTAFGLLGFAVSLVLSNLFEGQVWLSFAFILACGFFLHAPSGVFWTMPPLLSGPGKAAPQRGLINALGNVGGFVGPLFVGWLTDAFNSVTSFYSLTVFTLIGVAITLTLPALTRGTRRTADGHVEGHA